MNEKKKFLILILITFSLVALVYWSLTKFDFGDKDIVDDDGIPYTIFEIEGIIWLAENLNNSDHKEGESWCYQNNPENCSKYGRLYDLDAAIVACPDGWRLPSDDDWLALEKKLESFNDSIFNPLKGGHLFVNSFYEIDQNGYWWTCTMEGDHVAKIRILRENELISNSFSSDHGLSVRCIKD